MQLKEKKVNGLVTLTFINMLSILIMKSITFVTGLSHELTF